MSYWFSCKVKYMAQDEEGNEKKVSAQYLLQAINYTEAEANLHQKMEEYVKGAFFVESISKAAITDIFRSEEENKWVKVKVSTVEVDAIKGKETKSMGTYLIASDSCKEAIAVVEEVFSSSPGFVQIQSVTVTNILDVFPKEDFDQREEGESKYDIDPHTGEILDNPIL